MRHKYSVTSSLKHPSAQRNINYLNESIDTSRQVLARRPPKFLRILMTLGLLTSLHTRSGISPGHRMQDLQEMVELFPQYLNDESGWLSLLGRFDFACIWAVFFSKSYSTPIHLCSVRDCFVVYARHCRFFTNFTATACHSHNISCLLS